MLSDPSGFATLEFVSQDTNSKDEILHLLMN